MTKVVIVIMRIGGRVVDGARLESVYTGNRIVGSNPTRSATLRSSSFGWRATVEIIRLVSEARLELGVSPEAR